MARQEKAADLRLMVMFLRSLRRWTQEELSRVSGVDRGLISDYELGNKAPKRRTLERLTSAVGLPYSFVETLVPIFRAARLAVEGGRGTGHSAEAGTAKSISDGLERAIVDAILPSLAPHLLELEALMDEPEEEERPVPTSPSPPAAARCPAR
jgi:transcriptional regulator with XRE-family HTH domain